MSHLEARIVLQVSRFNLIQEAADFDDTDATQLNRQLINTRIEMLEQNWNKFLEEHENLCLSGGDNLSEKSYLKTRV